MRAHWWNWDFFAGYVVGNVAAKLSARYGSRGAKWLALRLRIWP